MDEALEDRLWCLGDIPSRAEALAEAHDIRSYKIIPTGE